MTDVLNARLTRDDMERRLLEAIADMGADPAAVTREARLDDLEIDSLDLVELTQIAEDEFRVTLEPSDMADVTTVGDAIDLVVSRAS
jgi:acyl carrier protein